MLTPMVPTSIEATVGPVAVMATPKAKTPVAMRTTKVLHLVNGEHFAGAERVQSHLGRCLPSHGFFADFACVKPGRFSEMLHEKRGAWGSAFDVPMSGRFDMAVTGRIATLVKDHGYELLHAHTPRTALLAAIVSRLTSRPWVYHVHSPASRDSDRPWLNRINAWTEKAALRSADHLITVSESLRDHCRAGGIADDRISVVHNGVPGIRPRRERFPSVGQRWTIGMIALMRPRKGVEVALDALALLRQSGHDVVLRCIGPFETPEYERQVKQQADGLNLGDNVQWVGFTDDVPAALSQLDAMLLPSLFGEGLPMVVLEAMAAAVPVIATHVEGTPEAITDGVEGLLAEAGNAESLADKITELVTGRHDWTAMSEAAYQRHGRQFSDLAMSNGVADVYRRVLDID
ncbi:glycosyltransferase [Crateriforma spongiae]|uniref:glycosyltransferase n=1 Tax=Crateriforma spongiae TaxID=2724528 RepID=UPI001448681D|nr:glycosyltransferase [Crateriforma spongiae]